MPNRSARVPAMTRNNIEQIQQLRQDLEGKAAAAAARNITLVQIEHLRALHAEMERCLATDVKRFASLNMAFHFEIYRIADNPVLLALIQMLWLRMAPAVASAGALLASKPPATRRAGLQVHEQLLKALQERDPAGAEAAMRKDLASVTQLPGYWESLGLSDG
jgi:DNA-binding GntR family transcriptional regulator